jgi:signal transduction histidine kinase
MSANAVILKPIREMSASMKKLADGDFDARIRLEGNYFPREIIDFSKDFNTAAQELSGVEVLRKDFINDFSHEFKTPIVSIGGFARHILDENLSKEEMIEYLQIIASESDRLAALATNVLNLTKVEAQTINIGKSTFNASEQIRRVVLMLESKLDEKELDLDLDIGEIEYYGNAELLNQVWVNLLDNSIKFSTKGTALNVKLFDFYDSVVFKVKDNGIGMDEATQARIFDKFYQSDTSRTTQGNGLGMTLVKKIVSLHDGKIEVESRLNKGTTVTVVLPK